MDSPIKEIITPKTKTKVELKEWITGGDFEEFQKELLKSIKIGADGTPVGAIDSSVVIAQNHKAIDLVVVSIDGGAEAILDTLKALPREDYQFVLDAINEITSPKVSGASVTNMESS